MSFTPEQVAMLDAPLNRARVKTRKQAGRDVSYIESWFAEAEANRIFGFDGWDSVIIEIRKVSEREVIIGKGGQYEKPGWSVSYIATVKVSVFCDGEETVRYGVGAGHGIDADPGQAHESAVKEATSDAEKRALKTFGNQFGLALYDKTQANVADAPKEPPKDAPKPSLTDRVNLVEKALTNAQPDDLVKVWTKASAVLAELSTADPDRLGKITALYESRLDIPF